MSQSCSGKCQTFISRRREMGSNFVHCFLDIIKYYCKYIKLMCVCLSRQCTMRDSLNTSYSFFQSGLFTIITSNTRINSGSIRASFRKWFSNRNAPTRAYSDEPRPRRRSSSLAGKITHPSYSCLVICVRVCVSGLFSLGFGQKFRFAKFHAL